jgi:hypothetical protein
MEEVVRQASAHAPPPTGTPLDAEQTSRRRPRRRLRTVVLAVVVLAAVAAGAVLVERGVHRGLPASRPAPPTATAADVARLEAATSDALAALGAERAGLASLAGVPTPATVAPVTDADAASLRLYDTVLTASPVPAGTTTAAAAVRREVHADAIRLQGVAALPPALLGAFLEDTTARAAHLQGVLRTFQHDLASPTGR